MGRTPTHLEWNRTAQRPDTRRFLFGYPAFENSESDSLSRQHFRVAIL